MERVKTRLEWLKKRGKDFPDYSSFLGIAVMAVGALLGSVAAMVAALLLVSFIGGLLCSVVLIPVLGWSWWTTILSSWAVSCVITTVFYVWSEL